MSSEVGATINDVINNSGYGWFSFKLTMIISMFYFLDLIQLSLAAILSPYLKSQWSMTSLETSIVSCCLLFGSSIGTTFFGRIGDLYGRKMALYTTLSLIIYFNFLCLFISKPIWYGVLTMLVGMGTGGSVVNIISYSSELVATQYRGKVVAFAIMTSSFGVAYVGLMGYLLLNSHGWKMYILVLLVPALLLVPTVKWLPESVKYLQTLRSKDSAQQIIHILSRLTSGNGKTLPRSFLTFFQRDRSTGKNYKNKGSALSLFSRKYLHTTISMMIIITCFNVTYFGTVYFSVFAIQNKDFCKDLHNTNHTVNSSGKLNDQDLLKNVYLTLFEVPGSLFFLFFVDSLGRKWSLCCSYIYLTVVYISQNFCLPNWLKLFLVLSGRAISCGSSIAAYLFTTESFPTILRSTGVGVCSTVGRCSLLFVPILFQDLIYVSLMSATMVIIAINFLSFVVCLTLKDTTGKTLEDS